jgi:hypothetical protein
VGSKFMAVKSYKLFFFLPIIAVGEIDSVLVVFVYGAQKELKFL